MVEILLEFLIPYDDKMITKSIRLCHFLNLNFQSPTIKNYLLEERDEKFFKFSYLLKRDDEMFIRYSAVQQTIEWIVESNIFKDIIHFDELQRGYGLSIYQSNNFLRSKDDYIKISKTLPFMMSETLFICPCDKILDNHVWNHFDCCIPFPQDNTLNVSLQKDQTKSISKS